VTELVDHHDDEEYYESEEDTEEDGHMLRKLQVKSIKLKVQKSKRKWKILYTFYFLHFTLILFSHLLLHMDEKVVDEVIELHKVLTQRAKWRTRKWYIEFSYNSLFTTSEGELDTDLVSFFGGFADIGVELAHEIGLDLVVDIFGFILELWGVEDDFGRGHSEKK
jgi:hypothetical protein